MVRWVLAILGQRGRGGVLISGVVFVGQGPVAGTARGHLRPVLSPTLLPAPFQLPSGRPSTACS